MKDNTLIIISICYLLLFPNLINILIPIDKQKEYGAKAGTFIRVKLLKLPPIEDKNR